MNFEMKTGRGFDGGGVVRWVDSIRDEQDGMDSVQMDGIKRTPDGYRDIYGRSKRFEETEKLTTYL